MGLLNLFVVATMPILEVILISFVGLILALDRFDILGKTARNHVNRVVFYLFNPALVASNFAKTVTWETFLSLWFMPVNMLLVFIIGTVLGWILFKVTKAPKHQRSLIIAACCAGNNGKLPIIIIPAMCKEKGSPFGSPDTCTKFAMTYVSVNMSLGAIYMWSYVYNLIRISSKNNEDEQEDIANCSNVSDERLGNDNTEPLLPSSDNSLISPVNEQKTKLARVQLWLTTALQNMNLKALLAPSIVGAVIGVIVGMVSPIRKLMVGDNAPLHIIEDSTYLLGEATIPTVTLILGANLLQGLKKADIKYRIVFGIAFVRYVLLPPIGILIIGAVLRSGILKANPLLHFVLLIEYAVPPSMNIGTMCQHFGSGHSAFSVILLWTYGLAAFTLTFWSTVFLWIVTST